MIFSNEHKYIIMAYSVKINLRGGGKFVDNLNYAYRLDTEIL